MELLTLTLSNYRNFSSKKIDFSKKLTVILGPNGVGKSNILEAVSILCFQKPTKAQTDLDLVKFSKNEAKIEGVFFKDGDTKRFTVNFEVRENRVLKSFFVDSLKKRFFDFSQIAAIVVFSPLDLDLVSGTPSLRRHHFDSLLSAADRDYWRNLSSYNKVVVRRNKVLTRIFDGKSKPAELSFWDARLVEHADYISKVRGEFFDFLNIAGPVTTFPPASARSDLRIKVRSKDQADLRAVGNPPSRATHDIGIAFSWRLKQSLVSAQKLLENRERDIAAGVTLSGPHRDDFRFFEGERDLEYFGSRGQQRMAVLYLKLAELEYLAKVKGWRPILALDDIFSELDWEHRDTILTVVGNQQTIITAAEKESVPKQLLKKAKVVEL